jgi:hypothetical protein
VALREFLDSGFPDAGIEELIGQFPLFECAAAHPSFQCISGFFQVLTRHSFNLISILISGSGGFKNSVL